MKVISSHVTNSAQETEALGFSFAENLKFGDTVLFYGELGAGKTEFAKGICKFFNVEGIITSPTFTIINQYFGENDDEKFTIYHIDLYRINDISELNEIGFFEIINDTNSIKIIEWPEKAGNKISDLQFTVRFDLIIDNENFRKIIIEEY